MHILEEYGKKKSTMLVFLTSQRCGFGAHVISKRNKDKMEGVERGMSIHKYFHFMLFADLPNLLHFKNITMNNQMHKRNCTNSEEVLRCSK